MTYVGIDVAKDKHDCYIANSNGEILADVFTMPVHFLYSLYLPVYRSMTMQHLSQDSSLYAKAGLSVFLSVKPAFS